MFEGPVGESEKRDIRKQTDRILRDLGYPEPPLRIADVLQVLSLDRQYYSHSDPGLIAELTHRFRLLTHRSIPDAGKHLLTALSKSKLCAFWIPDNARILVDADVPKPKHRWLEAHEITHSVLPWHRHFLLGDNHQTLDPGCHATLEAEANYGAGRILFLQDRFSKDARDLALTFPSIKTLAARYENSIVSTFWRMVEDRDPDLAVFGVISIHPLYPEVGKHDGPYPWRYFVRSNAFQRQFSNLSIETAYGLVTQYASRKMTGPIFSALHPLSDAAGDCWEFQLEAFSTKHALLTFGVPIRPLEVSVAVPGRL